MVPMLLSLVLAMAVAVAGGGAAAGGIVQLGQANRRRSIQHLQPDAGSNRRSDRLTVAQRHASVTDGDL